MMTTLLSLATSRIGLLVILAATLFAWHTFDKQSAVRQAVVGYVASAELTAAEAEAEVLRTKIERLEQANRRLAGQILEAEQEAADAEAARLDFLERTPAPAGAGVVSPGLLDVLRAD